MLRTYFLQKVKKYALQLLAFQCLVIFGLVVCFQYQFNQSKQQKEEMRAIFEVSHQSYNNFISVRNENYLSALDYKTDVPHRIYLRDDFELAKNIQKATDSLTRQIDTILLNRDKYEKRIDFNKMLFDYRQTVLMNVNRFEAEMDTSKERVIVEIFEQFGLFNTSLLLRNISTVNNIEDYWTYLEKMKTDLQFVQYEITNFFFHGIPDYHFCFYDEAPYVIADNRLYQGESSKAQIFLSKKNNIAPLIVIKNDTIPYDTHGFFNYELNTQKVGKHKITGHFLRGRPNSYIQIHPFTHEYTVLPKYN